MYRVKFDERDIQPQLIYLFIIPQLSELSLSDKGKSVWELLLPLGSNPPTLKEFSHFPSFSPYCTSDGDCVVEPMSQEEVVVVPD